MKQPTHFIVSMTAGTTKGSGSPMWRCVTSDGERVNVFKHNDPQKDSSSLFIDAGYFNNMESMVPNQELTWKNCPIPVVMIKNGQWWEIIAVGKRPVLAEPDPQFLPNHELYKEHAVEWARAVLKHEWVPTYWDTETTGLDSDAEIISIAVVASFGEMLFRTLIRPRNLDKLTQVYRGQRPTDITGITPEELETSPTFPQVYDRLCACLGGAIWVIYNAPFDSQILERDCIRHGLPPIAYAGINDAMTLFAEYYGEWDPVHKHFTSKSLSFAAEYLGIPLESAHDALADARTTLAVIEKIAEDTK